MLNVKPVIVDILFDAPQWGKSRLGCRGLIPSVLQTAWLSTPHRSRSLIPEVTVTLTGDDAIRHLNRDYRAKDKPTNVLSFPIWEKLADIPANMGPQPIGDIIIAFETIKNEAIEQQKPLKNHFTHMLVHGFLHLLGYDHIKNDDADAMESLEIKILKKMGIPNPYHL